MLPFTKRPGKGEESSDVVVKDDLAAPKSPTVPPPASSSRPTSLRPQQLQAQRNESSEDEMTGIVSSRNLTSPYPAPIPAAGRPAGVPPSSRRPPPVSGPGSIAPPARSVRPITVRPPPASQPPPNSYESANYNDGYDDEDAEDEDGGRTVVRAEGGPKIVRRANIQKASPSGNPTSISPAAVIRKTMESQRARNGGLMAGPPSELVEDNEDFTQAAPSRRTGAPSARGITGPSPRAGYSGPHSYEGPPSHPPRSNDSYRQMQDSSADDFRDSSPRSYAPPAHSGPVSTPSSRPGHFSQPPGDPRTVPSQGAYSQPPIAQPSTQQMQAQQQQQQGAMPAHFRMAQTGAVAGINAMNHGAPVHHPGMPFDPPGTAVTSNNSRMSGRPAMSWAAALAACGVFIGVVAVAIAQRGDAMSDTQASFVDPAHTGKAPATQPVTNDPAPQPLPPGLIGASPVQPVGQTPAQGGTAVPGMADPNLGLAAPTTTAAPAGTAPPPPSTVATLPGAKPPKAAPHWAPARPKPAAAAADNDDDETPKSKVKTAGAKPPKDSADDETKKALEALQKAQLESASSFGK
jgi:hypothetical protein